jgi:hypothetical protein
MISKPLLLLTCFSIGFLVTTAQIKKGGTFLGGNVSLLSVKNHIYVPQDIPQLQRTITISPVFGKAVRDNLIVGFSINFTLSNSEHIQNTKRHKDNQYGGGLFLRKYKALGAGFSIFAQGDLYAFQEETINYRDIETERIKGPAVGLGFYPGLSYSLNKRLQLETGFNNFFGMTYSIEKRTVKSIDNTILDKSTTNTLSIGTSLNNILAFNVGFRLLLSK